MSLHDDAAEVLRAYQPSDATQAAIRRQCLEYVLAHPGACARECIPDHVTASALIVTEHADEVLLQLHRKAGRWFQTGGHLEDPDASVEAGALREATEESGLADLSIAVGGPARLDVHPAPCATPGVRNHLDVQFLAVSAGRAAPVVGAESLDVRWFAVDDLPGGVDDSVRALVAAARARLTP